ncbi:hypothetical protein CVT24_002614 [Panaeolus cyanescens]|uniref:MATE efflux family protein n=1 Tax=Panaeolus cyanescens TaxID=181874 RepID=A0A409YTY9_9AGAR|nr:hypothetical protein CVT24_002614 [Panaeolus cyanescens]
MSSTYAHYQGPSSLPQDYAILNSLNNDNAQDDNEEPEYKRPTKMTIGTRHDLPTVTEATPLLAAPRIEESIDRNDPNDSEPATRMFWEELFILTKYALPVFGTHLLEYSLVIVSVVSIGHLSTTALAAISLGSMTASVSGFSVILGFASALDTLLPSAWTSSQPQLPTFIIWLNAEPILLYLKQEPEVAHFAALYLRYVSLGLPGLFDIPTRIVFVVAPINAILNYTLVWGPEPIRLGFIGAPIATAFSFNLISFLSLIYGLFYAPTTAWHPLSRRMFDPSGLLIVAKLGLSGVGQTASEWWAWELVALAASLLGSVQLACQSVLLVSASTTFQAPFALGVATSVRVGNLLGEGKAKRAGVSAKTSIVMAFAIAFFTSMMFLIFRRQWGYIFNNDPEVVELVASIIPLLSLFQVFDGTAAVTSGILRSIGKQFLGALLNLSAYYIFGIPLGIWLAFKADYGLHGLWIGLTASLVYAAVGGTWVCLRADWNEEVDKVLERLRKEREGEQKLNAGLSDDESV